MYNEEYNSFYCYCRDSKINKVKKYFKEEYLNGLKVNNKIYENPLSISLRKNNKKVVNFLLDKGADTNLKLNYRDNFLIPILSKYIIDRVDEVSNEYFIMTEEGHAETDLDKINSDILKLLEDIDSLKLLIDFNADFNKYDSKQGYTTLDFCYEENHQHAYNYLEKLGALHSKFFLEAYIEHEDKFKIYLEKNKYLNTEKFIEPYLPNIHQLIYHQVENNKKHNSVITLDRIKLFVIRGEKPNEKDYLGRTSVDYAIELGHHLAVDYLRSVGGKTSKELENEEK